MPKIIDEEVIFRAVSNLLVEKGYDRATTLEMAAAAGIHEATLFRKYGSKVGLIRQAIGYLLSKAPLTEVSYSGDLEADLRAILEAYVATSREYGEIVPMLLLEIPRYPELREALDTPLANIMALVQIIAKYQAEGRLKKEPPLLTVNALLAPILMTRMLQDAHTSLPAPEIDIQEFVKAFLTGRNT